jgi:hypothetical protein
LKFKNYNMMQPKEYPPPFLVQKQCQKGKAHFLREPQNMAETVLMDHYFLTRFSTSNLQPAATTTLFRNRCRRFRELGQRARVGLQKPSNRRERWLAVLYSCRFRKFGNFLDLFSVRQFVVIVERCGHVRVTKILAPGFENARCGVRCP